MYITQNVNSGILARGLAAYYPLKAYTGSVVTDYATSSNNGVMTGSALPWSYATWNSSSIAKPGGGLRFPGSGSMVVFPAAATNATDNFAISAWAYPFNSASGATQELYVNGNDSNAGSYIRWRDGVFFFAISGLGFSAAISGTVGRWNHVLVMRRNSQDYVFLNGISSNPGTFAPASASAGSNMGQNFYGYLDEVRVYNRALSNAEVLQLYRNPSSPTGVK